MWNPKAARFGLVVGMVAAVVLIWGSGASVDAAGDRRVPRFEEADCKFVPPEGQNVTCGYLLVPEDRAATSTPTIKLHVAIFKALSAHPHADPIIYLEGGPGGSSLKRVAEMAHVFAPYMQDHDFIFFDQRGVGLSEPTLECPEIMQAEINFVEHDMNDLEDYSSGLALLTCRNRLRKQGIELGAYNSAANASDVADLRRALNIDSWDLYGISYGTRLALITMRDHPEGIRSVILDSTFPPDINLNGTDFGRSAQRAVDTLFDGCIKDKACRTNYPNLRGMYDTLLRRLDRNPAHISYKPVGSDKSYKLTITGYLVDNVLTGALYSTNLIPQLPAAIANAYEGDFSVFAELILRGVDRDGIFSHGMYYSVMCADRSISASFCAEWGVSAQVPARPKAVTSSLPTLIFAGEYDPVTPPTYGERALRTLKNGFLFEFPGYGHGVSVVGECSRAIMLAFLDDPKHQPDQSCLKAITSPDFTAQFF